MIFAFLMLAILLRFYGHNTIFGIMTKTKTKIVIGNVYLLVLVQIMFYFYM